MSGRPKLSSGLHLRAQALDAGLPPSRSRSRARRGSPTLALAPAARVSHPRALALGAGLPRSCSRARRGSPDPAETADRRSPQTQSPRNPTPRNPTPLNPPHPNPPHPNPPHLYPPLRPPPHPHTNPNHPSYAITPTHPYHALFISPPSSNQLSTHRSFHSKQPFQAAEAGEPTAIQPIISQAGSYLTLMMNISSIQQLRGRRRTALAVLLLTGGLRRRPLH